MKSFYCLSLVFILTACATVHPGREGQVLSGNPNIVVSVEKNSDYSDATNQFYTVTIENTGTDWLRIDEVDLDFTNEDNVEHRLVVGPDLNAWIDSNTARMAIKRQNDQMINDIVGVTGAIVMVAAASRGDSTGTLLGGTAFAGAGLRDEVHRQKGIIRAAESAQMVPNTHLYAPFTVPSSGFRRAWFVVHTPQQRIADTATLRLKTIDGKVSLLKVPLSRPPRPHQ